MKKDINEMFKEIIEWARINGYTVNIHEHYSVPRKGRHDHMNTMSVYKNIKCRCGEDKTIYKAETIFFKKKEAIEDIYNQMLKLRGCDENN